ncbi:nicotinate phosphoribosyltransferase [Methylopila capsulata]|uniref:Nicotinate phosphoribosyltransferase n=1 Tax=Methylopila capsulata TaxID=61654 RepID=A0A9W6MR73_9HYPH|nr:nicotinate phosphoribosyltransferase [Methylopila capsulata]
MHVSDQPSDFVAQRTDAYFAKTAEIVAAHGDARVTYAVFLRADAVVALDRAIAFLEDIYPANAAIPLTLDRPAPEGAALAPGKPMLYVTGSLAALSPIETLLLQRIGFACVSAFNAFSMALALPDCAFLAMEARHTTGDDMHIACSYGASVGSRTAQLMGAKGFIGTSTDLAAPLYGTAHGLGTMPHSLIGYAKALMLKDGRDPTVESATLEAAKLYAAQFPDEPGMTVLVDYDGREVTDALAVCRWFYAPGGPADAGRTLSFRLDTHGGRHLEGLDWDESVRTLLKWTHRHTPGEVAKLALQGFDLAELDGLSADEIRDKVLFGTGVTAAAVIFFRKALDDAGFKQPKIVASSGFDTLKCRVFGNLSAPVDVVGTGSFLPSKLSRTYATADIVRYELPEAGGGWRRFDLVKVGREFLKIS